jgi:hypothetical protein
MPTGIQLGAGVQRLVDAHLRFVRAAAPVCLRLRNFPDVQEYPWSQLGFAIAPTGTLETGTTDIVICPPPAIRMISVHNIGQSMGKLRFGARMFFISATFVENQMREQGLTDQTLVWRGSNVVGLVTDGLLFSIEDVAHEEVGGRTIAWTLMCNAGELR